MNKPQWMYSSNGEGFGPFTERQLKQLISAGLVQSNDRIWRSGDTESQSVASFSEPPPLPRDRPAPTKDRKIVWIASLLALFIAFGLIAVAEHGMLFKGISSLADLPTSIADSQYTGNEIPQVKNNDTEMAPTVHASDFANVGLKQTVEAGSVADSPEDKVVSRSADLASSSPTPPRRTVNSTRISDASSARTGGNVLTLRGHTSYVPHVVVSSDGQRVASGSNDKTVRIWDISHGKQLHMFDGFSTALFGVAFDPDGKHVWACERTSVRKIEIATGRIASDFEISKVHGFNQHSVAFDNDCTRLVTQNTGVAYVYDLKSGRKMNEIKGWADSLDFGDNSNSILFGGSEKYGVIKLCNANTGQVTTKFHGLKDRTIDICVSPNRKYIAASSGPSKGRPLQAGDRLPECRVIVWNPEGKIEQSLVVEEGWQWALAFTPDNRHLITGGSANVSIGIEDWFSHKYGADRTIRIWEVATKRMVESFEGHKAAVLSLALTPDGRKLVSGSADSTIRVWNMP